MLAAGLVAAACARDPLTVTRSPCPAAAIPNYVGSVTRFDPPQSRNADAIDFVAQIVDLTPVCVDSPDSAMLVTTLDFKVTAQRRELPGRGLPARTVALPMFVALVRPSRYTYDLLDRCVRQDIAPGPTVAPTTTFETFAYDGRSRLVLASNDVSRATFRWNSLSQPMNVGQDEFACAAQHDALGNRLALTLPSGRTLTTTFDRLNRPTSLSLQTGGQVTPLATLAYEGPDRLGRVARGNGINTRLNWNGTMQPPNPPGDFGWQQILRINHARAQGGAVLDQRGYAYDRNQNKTARAQLVPFTPGGPLLTNRWDTDALDRLVQSERETGGAQSFRQYQLDSNGNRQLVIENGLAQTYLMNTTLPEPADFQMNQYTVSPFGEYQYDANGNRSRWNTPAGEFLYTYDYADRLVAVERMEGGVPAPVVNYTYDALGRRITRTVHQPPPLAPVTTRYIHDPVGGGVIEEWRSGTLRLTMVGNHIGGAASAAYAATGKAIIPASGQVFHVLTDDLGNELALTDASGAVLERYDYDDFGQPAFLDANGDPLLDGSGVPVNRSQAGLDYLFGGLFWEPDLGIYLDEGSLAFDPQVAMPLAKEGMPNRISMNVSVAKQTQGATFGERVNAGSKVVEKASSGLKDTLKTQVRTAGGGTKQKKWLPSNFRLRIDGLDESCTRHGRKLLDRGEAGDNVGLLLRTAGSGAPGAGARIPLWKKVLNYVWEWDPWDPNGGHDYNQYAGADR